MTLYPIECGNFKLDGGAMFGVVPKVLWERTNPADGKNKIDLATRSLLIEDGNKLVLIDCGLGNKQDKRFFSHYDLWGGYSLEHSLHKAGFSKDDVTDVFFTHLHFDHCGGAVHREQDILRPFFSNATFWTHTSHYDWATNPNPREKASFLKENFVPLEEAGQLSFIDAQSSSEETTLNLGSIKFDIELADGHTEKQMLPKIQYKGKTIVYCADLIPTVGHIPLVYVMGYDTRPLLTMTEKDIFLKKAAREEWILFFEHDAHNVLASLEETERGVKLKQTYTWEEMFGNGKV